MARYVTREQSNRLAHAHAHERTRTVARDVAERPGRALLHAGIELLEADHEGIERAAVHHSLRELRRVLRHRTQYKRCGFLVETLLTVNTY